MKKLSLLLLLLVFGLVGCENLILPKINKADYDKVTAGMSTEDVIEILGTPSQQDFVADAGIVPRTTSSYSQTTLYYEGANVTIVFQFSNNQIFRKFTQPNGEWDDDTQLYQGHPLYGG
ncbi:outer membrane protein assembly factor BamE [Mariniblastus sp.]|nr:outer membrane protein assembly factor BamE [Mariniblastus sp.]